MVLAIVCTFVLITLLQTAVVVVTRTVVWEGLTVAAEL